VRLRPSEDGTIRIRGHWEKAASDKEMIQRFQLKISLVNQKDQTYQVSRLMAHVSRSKGTASHLFRFGVPHAALGSQSETRDI